MAIRLVKVAKELNMSSSSLVEYLIGKGFEIISKPTFKLTDVMYGCLYSAFGNSSKRKEELNKLAKNQSIVVDNNSKLELSKPTCKSVNLQVQKPNRSQIDENSHCCSICGITE